MRHHERNGSFRSKDAVPRAPPKAERVSAVAPSLRHAHDLKPCPFTSKQQSIQKVVGYALKYHSLCAEDLWDCVMEECQKVRCLARSHRRLELMGSIR